MNKKNTHFACWYPQKSDSSEVTKTKTKKKLLENFCSAFCAPKKKKFTFWSAGKSCNPINNTHRHEFSFPRVSVIVVIHYQCKECVSQRTHAFRCGQVSHCIFIHWRPQKHHDLQEQAKLKFWNYLLTSTSIEIK